MRVHERDFYFMTRFCLTFTDKKETQMHKSALTTTSYHFLFWSGR